jgi:hypothetical protein
MSIGKWLTWKMLKSSLSVPHIATELSVTRNMKRGVDADVSDRSDRLTSVLEFST